MNFTENIYLSEKELTENDIPLLENYNIQEMHPGINVSWENISVKVKLGKKDSKTILHDLSGHAKQGELMAIMGPSGAGKTTFLGTLGKKINSKNK